MQNNNNNKSNTTGKCCQQSESTVFSLFDSFPEPVFIIDPEGIILEANISFAARFSKRPEECAGTNVYDILSCDLLMPEIAEHRRKKAEEVLHTGKRLFFDDEHDGKTYRSTIYPILSSDGSIARLLIIAQNVTELHHTEAITDFHLRLIEMTETHSAEELLRATLDEAERITGSIASFCHTLKSDQSQLLLRIWSTNTFKNTCRTQEKEEECSLNNYKMLADIFREKKSIMHNDSCSHRNCQSMLDNYPDIRRELLVPVLRNEQVIAIFGVCNKPSDYDEIDARYLSALTDRAWETIARKNAEQLKKSIEETLIQSQKMEVVGQLAGGIAHDFNNMLGIILGHAELAINKAEYSFDDLEAIHKAASHSADLTRQLLAFARKQVATPKVIEINFMIEEMLPMLRRLIGENISLLWRRAPGTNVRVTIDTIQLNQILTNLCVNARDAIGGIGEIAIATEIVHVVNGDTAQPCTLPGDYIILSVTDNGRGIPKENLPHIFEPFFTTKEKGKGTGLGLSTVYGIVKQNNGYIDCQNMDGNGCTFRVYLPRQKHLDVQASSDQQKVIDPEFCNETILLVEDNLDILQLCGQMLENIGYTVVLASRPTIAIQLAEKYEGMIDLLLTDVIMPEMNGCDLSKRLQSIYPGIRTIFMSGYTADILDYNGGVPEEMNFIEKPFTINALTGIVKEALSLSPTFTLR